MSRTKTLYDEFDPQEEDEAIAEFTLAHGSAETVEELTSRPWSTWPSSSSCSSW